MKKETEMGMLLVPNLRILTFTTPVNREVDLPEAKGAMPSRKVISDGRKHIAPPHACNALHAVKKRLERLLSKSLVRFLGGFFGSEFAVRDTLAQVPDIELAWNEAMEDLVSRLPELYAEQEAEAGAQWVPILQRARLSEDEVWARCRFNVGAVSIAKVHDIGTGDLADAAFEAVLTDLATDASRIKRTAFCGKPEVVAASVTPVRGLVAKLRSFSFADPRLSPIADAFDAQLSMVPLGGRLTSAQTAIVLQILGLMEDSDALVAQGAIACKVFTRASDLFAKVEPAAMPVVVPAPTPVALPPPALRPMPDELRRRVAAF